MKKIYTRVLLAFALLSSTTSFGQIAAWDFTNEGSTTNTTSIADIYNANLDAANLLTRGSGAAWSNASNSFRTSGFQNNGISTSNTDYFQFTLSAASGNTLSLSTIDAKFAGTATFAASPGVSSQFAYSLDGTNFTLIGSPQITTGTPATLTQINLSGISALQNIAAATTVTFRYYASGQTATGGWGFNSPSSGSYGLAIGGSFCSLVTSITPPDDQTVAPSTDGNTLTVIEGTPVVASRQWKYSTSSGGPYINISGETNTTYTPNFASIGPYYVICETTYGSPCGNVVISNEVLINVVTSTIALSPVNQPKGPYCNNAANNISLTYNTSGTITAPFIELSNASGSFASGTTNLGGTITGSGPYTISGTIPALQASGTLYRIRIVSTDFTPVISGNNGSNITISSPPVVAPITGGQSSVCSGYATAAFTDATPGGSWFITNGSPGSATNVGGVVTGGIPGSVSVNYLVSNAGCSNVASTSLIINATPANPTGTITGTTPACSSTSLTFSGAAADIYWQTASNGTSTANVSTTPLNVTTSGSYYVRAYNGTCWSTGQVGPYNVVINTPTTVAAIGGGQASVCSGYTTAPFTDATPGGTWGIANIAGGPTSSATISSGGIVTGVAADDVFVTYKVINGACTTIVNKPLTINATPANPAGTISGTTPACGSTSLMFSGAAAGIYWQTGSNGTSTTNVSTTPLNVATPGSSSYYVRANLGTCWSIGQVGPYTVTVNTPPTITAQPTDKTVTSPTSATFSVTASGTGITYQWQRYNGSAWVALTNTSPYSGVTTATLTISPTSVALSDGEYRCIISGTSPCTSLTSNSAILTVNNGPCLSEGFSGGATAPAGWTFTGFVPADTYTSAGNFGVSSPSLQFNATGDVVQTYTISSTASQLSFWIKGQGSTGSSFLVQGWNGSAWVTVENITSIPTTGTTKTYNASTTPALITGLSQFRFIYTRSAGNVAFDDVRVTCDPVACTSTATISSFTPTTGPAGTQVTITGTGFTGATAVKFGGLSASVFTVVNTTSIIAKVPTGAGTGEISVTVSGCDAVSSASFTIINQAGTCGSSGSGSTVNDISISEVYDAYSGSLSYIEIFNGTASTVVLGAPNNYVLRIRTGVSTDNDYALSGNLTSGATYLIRLGSDGSPTCPGLTLGIDLPTASGFNGNDRIYLIKNGVDIDYVPNPNYGGAKKPGFSQTRKALTTAPTIPSTTYTASDWVITTTESCSNLGVAPYAVNGSSINITSQPGNVSVCGAAITFSVTATGAGSGTTAYVWKYFNTATSTWDNASGITDANLGVTASGTNTSSMTISGNTAHLNNYQFYSEIQRGSCIINSNAVQYTYNTRPFYRSKGTGNWSNPATWEMSNSSSDWSAAVPACQYPIKENSSQVFIEATDLVTQDINIDIDFVQIKAGGTLLTTPNSQLAISDSTAGADFIIDGTYIDETNAVNGIVFASGASWSIAANSTLIKSGNGSSANYRDYYETGIANIPATANWIYRYTGTALSFASSTTTTSMHYPNLTLENTTAGTYSSSINNAFPDLSLFTLTGTNNLVSIKGNFDVGGTGTGYIVFSNINTKGLVTIGGSLIVRSGSTLNNGNGTRIGSGFDIKGNVTVAGSLTVNSGNTGLLSFTGTTQQIVFGGGIGSGNINLQNVIVNNTSTGVIIARDLSVGGNLTLTQGLLNPLDYTLSLAGQVIRTSGNIDGDSATINMTGTVAQTIPPSTFQANNLRNLIISNTETTNGVTLGGKVDLYGVLSFGNGPNKVLKSNQFLTLRSTAVGTAMVADVSNNGVYNNNRVTGNVIVERYFPNRRAWRLLTAPVTNTGTIYQQWQNGGNYIPNVGTYVTKPFGACCLGDGLEQSLKYSMDTFNVATQNLDYIKNSNISLSGIAGTAPANKGYFTFVRGDRTLANLIPPNSNITSLRDTGLLQTYTKTFSRTLGANKFMLIGNPYASPVDFGKLSLLNVLRKFYAWDPRLNLTLGAYVLVDGQGGPGYSYIITPAPDPMANVSGQDSIIQSSQAIFVQADVAGSASVTFNESDKVPQDNNTVFRPALSAEGPQVDENLRVNLYLNEPDTAILADGVYEQLNNSFSADIDGLDALKFTNFLENFGIVSHGKTLTLERRPLIEGNDTIFFKLWNTTERNYQLRFISNNMNHPGLEGWLEDSYTKAKTPVDLNGYTNISFSVTGDAASKAQNRFMLVFKDAAGGPLPLTFTTVKTSQQNSNVNVEWNVVNEMNIEHYEVERSTDGVHFTKVGSVTATGNSTNTSYQLPDEDVAPGTYYYRIRSVGNNGEVKYSDIVKVTIGKGAVLIVVSPNPIQGSSIHLQLVNQPKGRYGIRLLNNLGQLIMIKQIDHEEGSSTETLLLSKTLAHGSYKLEIIKPDNNKVNINVLY